jgi:hypothetical protein
MYVLYGHHLSAYESDYHKPIRICSLFLSLLFFYFYFLFLNDWLAPTSTKLKSSHCAKGPRRFKNTDPSGSFML